MKLIPGLKIRFRSVETGGGLLGALVLMALIACSGCSSFSPAFVDLLDPTGESGLVGIENAPGHVIVAFVNNAVIDERIISYLESAEGGSLVLTDAEKRSLRPLIRFRILVTFTDGSVQVLEFISGNRIVDPRQANLAEPDFDQPDFTNAVVLCDVQRVELLPNSPIEVYLPVEIDYYAFIDPTQEVEGEWRLVNTLPPSYYPLQVDAVIDSGFTIQRNIGIRDVVPPVINPGCGTSVSIVLSGALSVPFLTGRGVEEGQPSVDEGAADTVATIGGRYGFEVSIR